MKFLLVLFLVVSTGNALAKEITVKVQGMVCSMCAQGITKKFKSVDGIKKLDVNLDDKVVRIETEGNMDIQDDKIKSIITEAGYSVASIDRK
jgi:copper chaperone CopZ